MHREAVRRDEELRVQLEETARLTLQIEQEVGLRMSAMDPAATLPDHTDVPLAHRPPVEGHSSVTSHADSAHAAARSETSALGHLYVRGNDLLLPSAESGPLERLVPSALVAHRMEALRLLEQQQEALRAEEAERRRMDADRLHREATALFQVRESGASLAARAQTDRALAAVQAEAARVRAEDAVAARLHSHESDQGLVHRSDRSVPAAPLAGQIPSTAPWGEPSVRLHAADAHGDHPLRDEAHPVRTHFLAAGCGDTSDGAFGWAHEAVHPAHEEPPPEARALCLLVPRNLVC
jgi:hypothetical protein